MYCNPSVPLDTDTTELRKIFRAPPKSDGNVFSTFTLFELIQKLELKEIKTWEPPALDKGQSAQKVQQYAVRLKVS
jgi:protein-tyrosine phosphatase